MYWSYNPSWCCSQTAGQPSCASLDWQQFKTLHIISTSCRTNDSAVPPLRPLSSCPGWEVGAAANPRKGFLSRPSAALCFLLMWFLWFANILKFTIRNIAFEQLYTCVREVGWAVNPSKNLFWPTLPPPMLVTAKMGNFNYKADSKMGFK